MNGRRVQLTVRLEPEVFRAAKERATRSGVSLSAAVAEAAKESLLSTYRGQREAEILRAVDRNFHKVARLERRLWLEVRVLKEMVGLGMRSFFNHTPAVPETEKAAALLSGKARFHRYLDLLAENLRGGESIMNDIPADAPAEPADTASPRATDGVLGIVPVADEVSIVDGPSDVDETDALINNEES